MEKLDSIGAHIQDYLEEKNIARESALKRSRTLIRHCATAIRAVHRGDRDLGRAELQEARQLCQSLREGLSTYPDLFHAGYTQDAFKEFAEASIVYAIIGHEPLPHPDELEVEYAAYLNGLGEVVGELRRRVLDLLRRGDLPEAERLLEVMDDIYTYLMTLDYPSALTNNLRRITDMVRAVTERTRGDLTTTHQQHQLHAALRSVEDKLNRS